MHLLYLDSAGSVADPSHKHFILAGVSIFERQAYWLQRELERLAEGLAERLGNPTPERMEFHGNPIRKGDSWWRKMGPEERYSVIMDALLTVRTLRGQWELFGIVVDKRALSPEDPVEYAFEQVSSRFDQFLGRMYRRESHPQRGLIVLDKPENSTQETRIQSLASEFRTFGNRWSTMRNLVDVPFFVDSKATRLIQYADLVSYALWRKFEHQDGEFFDVISDLFDSEGDIVHGLHHYRNLADPCDCPACAPRHQ